MWKIVVAFLVFAALALLMLSKGGDIDLSGEKHGDDATHAAPATVAPTPAASASAAPAAPASAASAPAVSASK